MAIVTRLRAWLRGGAWRRVPRAVALQGVAVLMLLVALAQPRWPMQQPRWNHIVYLDITQSMNTRDMHVDGQPASRLAFVQQALHEALLRLPCGSRLGLGLFTEYRVLVLMVPLEVCANYDDLLASIMSIDGRMSWAGASEVSKGVYWALRTTQELAGPPSLMFITDGHEAPPLRPGAAGVFGELPRGLQGSLLGVGGFTPTPIPKFDPDGHPLGFWEADEVMQTDSISAGRTIGGTQQALVEADGRPVTVYPGSGAEHLSTLKEPHLQQLAAHHGLSYRRLAAPDDLAEALQAPALAQQVRVPRHLRAVPLGLALAALVAAWLGPPRRRRDD